MISDESITTTSEHGGAIDGAVLYYKFTNERMRIIRLGYYILWKRYMYYAQYSNQVGICRSNVAIGQQLKDGSMCNFNVIQRVEKMLYDVNLLLIMNAANNSFT